MQRVVGTVLAYATFVNGGTVALFWYDKQQALQHGWRVPEKSMCISALLGGWIGGYWAMEMFRHKTKKQSFRIGYHIATAVNVACVSLLMMMMPRTRVMLLNSQIGREAFKVIQSNRTLKNLMITFDKMFKNKMRVFNSYIYEKDGVPYITKFLNILT